MSTTKEEKSLRKNMNKKLSKGTSLRCKSKVIKSANKSTGRIKGEGKQFDVDSLVVLDNAKERKKLDGIDEKIKLLKTELRSLIGGTKTDKNSEHSPFKSNLASNNLGNAETKTLEYLGTDIKSAQKWEKLEESETRLLCQKTDSTPLKFSEWFDKTVDEIDTNFKNKKLTVGTLFSSSKVIDSTDATLPSHSLPPNLTFGSSNVPILSQQNVECLLYKSFLIENSDLCLTSSDVTRSEVNSFASKKRQQNIKKPRKLQKKYSRGRKANENNFSSCNRFLRRGVTSRMQNSSTCFDDIEEINLDSSSNSCKMTNTEYLDLDVSMYDWSEPFNITEETDIYSDVQIIEDNEKKNDCINHKELKSNTPEVTENNRSNSSADIGEIQPKTVWECPVCFERSKGQEVVATQCGHVFCRKCLEDHISKLCNNCPSCRCALKEKPFITLFNF